MCILDESVVCTRLGVADIQVFWLFFEFLPLNLLLVRSHQAEKSS